MTYPTGTTYSADVTGSTAVPTLAIAAVTSASGPSQGQIVDIGTRTEEGQLLAELDAPELTRGLEGAKAELTRALALDARRGFGR